MICFAHHIKAIEDYSLIQIFTDTDQSISIYYSNTEPAFNVMYCIFRLLNDEFVLYRYA